MPIFTDRYGRDTPWDRERETETLEIETEKHLKETAGRDRDPFSYPPPGAATGAASIETRGPHWGAPAETLGQRHKEAHKQRETKETTAKQKKSLGFRV